MVTVVSIYIIYHEITCVTAYCKIDIWLKYLLENNHLAIQEQRSYSEFIHTGFTILI